MLGPEQGLRAAAAATPGSNTSSVTSTALGSQHSPGPGPLQTTTATKKTPLASPS